METKIQHDISLTLLRSATVVSIELEKDNSDSAAKKWPDGATVKSPKEACELNSKNTDEIKIKLII